MNGSDTCSTEDGGEWVGVTLTFAENCGSKFLVKIKASSRLKHSAHFESKSAILSSAEDGGGFETVAVGDLSFLPTFLESFLTFLSGGGASTVGLEVLGFSTGPITDTLDGSTKSSLSLVGVASSFLASLFSFLILYEGVAS